MVEWYRIYRETGPHNISRLNRMVIDLSADFRPANSPMQAATDAVIKISQTYPAPYTLFVSGGIDSQAMVLAWKESGVPFTAVHYSYGTNITDRESVVVFCKKHNIPLEIRHFDAKSFIMSPKLQEMAIRYDCNSPHILTYIEFTKLHAETCVMAGNFISEYTCGIDWTIHGLQRFAEMDKPNFIPFFFMFSPALAYSFSDIERAAMHDVYSVKPVRDTYRIKVMTYRAAGFDITAQDKKYTGFEEIKESFDDSCIEPLIRLKWKRMPSKRPFDLIYRYSLFDAIGSRYSDSVVLRKHKDYESDGINNVPFNRE